MGQSYNTILPAVQAVQATIAQLANANGMVFLQVINALQAGNTNLTFSGDSSDETFSLGWLPLTKMSNSFFVFNRA